MTGKWEPFSFAQLRLVPPLGERHAPQVCTALLKLWTGTCNTLPKLITLFLTAQQWHINNEQSCGQPTVTISGLLYFHWRVHHFCYPYCWYAHNWPKILEIFDFVTSNWARTALKITQAEQDLKKLARSSQWKHQNSECMHKEVWKLTETQPSFSTCTS